jgi:hypothetical protein
MDISILLFSRCRYVSFSPASRSLLPCSHFLSAMMLHAVCGGLKYILWRSNITSAFVVAWGGMAAQSGRLVGALIVIFELRRMGVGESDSLLSMFAAQDQVSQVGILGSHWLASYRNR